MDSRNICKFNPGQEESENISVLDYIFETEYPLSRLITRSIFRLHLVSKGNGFLNTLTSQTAIQEGDIFITFPSTSYSIANIDSLEYYYISFVGLRVYKLLERAGLDRTHFIQHNMHCLLDFWKNSLELAGNHNIDLIAESVLLYSLGVLCRSRKEEKESRAENFVLQIKKIAEDRFCDPALDLKTICQENFYNFKYASASFKKVMGIGFAEYLTSLRINNAVRLIESGMTSIKQIASLSGYNDPLYFSKQFRKNFGSSPSERINELKNSSKP